MKLEIEDDVWSIELESLLSMTVLDVTQANLLGSIARLEAERSLSKVEFAVVNAQEFKYEVLYVDGTKHEGLVMAGVTTQIEDQLFRTTLSNYIAVKEWLIHMQVGRAITVLMHQFGLFRVEIVRK